MSWDCGKARPSASTLPCAASVSAEWLQSRVAALCKAWLLLLVWKNRPPQTTGLPYFARAHRRMAAWKVLVKSNQWPLAVYVLAWNREVGQE